MCTCHVSLAHCRGRKPKFEFNPGQLHLSRSMLLSLLPCTPKLPPRCTAYKHPLSLGILRNTVIGPSKEKRSTGEFCCYDRSVCFRLPIWSHPRQAILVRLNSSVFTFCLSPALLACQRHDRMPRARRGGTGFSFDLRSCLTICFCSLALLAAIGSKYVAENNLRPVLSLKLLSEPPREPQLEVKAVEPEVTTSETSGTLAFSPTPAPAQPLQQLQHCSTISFLRIQKTASTTFGHEMMQKMCGKRRQRCKQNWDRCAFGKQTCGVELYDYHLEYNLARQLSQMGKGRGCVVTFLRGPVETWGEEMNSSLFPSKNP